MTGLIRLVYANLFSQLLSTADDVAKLQEELETMRPLLEEAKVETDATMEQIAQDTVCLKNCSSFFKLKPHKCLITSLRLGGTSNNLCFF